VAFQNFSSFISLSKNETNQLSLNNNYFLICYN